MERLERMQQELLGTYDELRTAKARLAEKLMSAQARFGEIEQVIEEGEGNLVWDGTSAGIGACSNLGGPSGTLQPVPEDMAAPGTARSTWGSSAGRLSTALLKDHLSVAPRPPSSSSPCWVINHDEDLPRPRRGSPSAGPLPAPAPLLGGQQRWDASSCGSLLEWRCAELLVREEPDLQDLPLCGSARSSGGKAPDHSSCIGAVYEGGHAADVSTEAATSSTSTSSANTLLSRSTSGTASLTGTPPSQGGTSCPQGDARSSFLPEHFPHARAGQLNQAVPTAGWASTASTSATGQPAACEAGVSGHEAAFVGQAC
mmetsp:Transcript_42520/g.98561  ORF Transcript_42520/g.98561 Transcript_42520/m.98561 type:complete len:315 (-) Transcript_42520:1176-2120(-)